jgi:hypothetical protein
MRTSYEKVLRFAAQMVMNANEQVMADLKSALGVEKAMKASAYKKREAENVAISKAWFEENYDALYDLLRERPEWFENKNI